MRLNELRDTSFEIAKSKGWHDPEFDTATFADRMALVISELAEALEEHRKGKPARNIEYVKGGVVACTYAPSSDGAPAVSAETIFRTALSLIESGHKPEGVVIELVDVLIRIGDCAGKYGFDLDAMSENEHNCAPIIGVIGVGEETKVEENGGWRTAGFGDWFCDICASLVAARLDAGVEREFGLTCAALKTCRMARSLGISGEELERAIEIKHAYNRTRTFRHGGKKL